MHTFNLAHIAPNLCQKEKMKLTHFRLQTKRVEGRLLDELVDFQSANPCGHALLQRKQSSHDKHCKCIAHTHERLLHKDHHLKEFFQYILRSIEEGAL